MYWCSLIKCQLRAYLCRDMIREDLLEQLLYIDDDIQISTMRISDMPRSRSLPSSTVERQAENREAIRDKVNAEISRFDKSCERMAAALLTLGDDEHIVVTHSYFSVDYEDDDLAHELGTSAVRVRELRSQALRKLYQRLTLPTTQQILINRIA